MKTKYRLLILVVTLRYTHILQLVKSTKDTVAKPSESVKMLSVTLDSKHVSYINIIMWIRKIESITCKDIAEY